MRRRTAPPRPKSPEPKSRRVAGPGVTPPTLAFLTVPTGAMRAVTMTSAFAVGPKTTTVNTHAAIASINFTSLSSFSTYPRPLRVSLLPATQHASEGHQAGAHQQHRGWLRRLSGYKAGMGERRGIDSSAFTSYRCTGAT